MSLMHLYFLSLHETFVTVLFTFVMRGKRGTFLVLAILVTLYGYADSAELADSSEPNRTLPPRSFRVPGPKSAPGPL